MRGTFVFGTLVLAFVGACRCEQPDARCRQDVASLRGASPSGRVLTRDASAQIVRERDGGVMVLVPGGRTWVGAVPQDQMAISDEKPGRFVSVRPFYVDRTEVTVGQFRRFANSTGYVTDLEKTMDGGTRFGDPPHRESELTGVKWFSPPPEDLPPATAEALPVTFVTWNDAMAYCRWVDCDLPSEEQFEYLLRSGSTTQGIYPWGDAPSPPPRAGNFADMTFKNAYEDVTIIFEGYDDGHVRSSVVGSFAADRFGLYDVAGNVKEWCSGLFRPYSEAHEGLDETGKIRRVLRGGSYYSQPLFCRCSIRTSADAETAREHWGFRCVRPAGRL